MNVVYAMTRNVYEWILPSLRSLAEHHPDARVFILAEDDKLPFELPITATIINVSGQKYFPKSECVNYTNMFSYINLLKVRYPSILEGVDKVIHLDIDTIICDSLEGMWNTDLSGKWFGAVQEYKGKYRPFGERYYNAGVLVINLEQMRSDKAECDMQCYLNTVRQPWADQDAWNKYGLKDNKIVTMDVRWNESQMTGYTDNPAIVHYCGYRDWWTKQDMHRVGYLNKYKRCGGMKILIAVPTYENIYPDTFKSIYDLDIGDNTVDFEFVRGYDVAKARNNIAKLTIEGGYDYVLMVDNDEVLPKSALLNMLETDRMLSGHSLIVGYCLSRPEKANNTTGRTTAFKFGGKNYVKEDALTAKELKEIFNKGTKCIRIRGSGLGCALIHRTIFERLDYPYFKWVEYESGARLSEDLFFCEKLGNEDIGIFADTRVACGHMMRHVEYI